MWISASGQPWPDAGASKCSLTLPERTPNDENRRSPSPRRGAETSLPRVVHPASVCAGCRLRAEGEIAPGPLLAAFLLNDSVEPVVPSALEQAAAAGGTAAQGLVARQLLRRSSGARRLLPRPISRRRKRSSPGAAQ
jgi:hypothetical protein